MENNVNNNEKKSNFAVKISVIFLFLLVCLSVVILLSRLAVSRPYADDIFAVDTNVKYVEVSDGDVIWDVDADITIFEVVGVNEHGKVTVKSSTGSKVVAPGMEGLYRFQIKNVSKFAVDAKTSVYAVLSVNGEVFENAPIEVRFRNYLGECVASDDWISINEFASLVDEEVIGVNSYIYFDLDWRWNFEGDDTVDTLLGDLSVDNDVKFEITIVSSATRAASSDALGGLSLGDAPFVEDVFDLTPFIIMNCIAALIICILLHAENKRENKKIIK